MNLIEALRLKRPLRRPISDDYKLINGECWLPFENVLAGLLRRKNYDDWALCYEDLLADDWEVKEEEISVTITKKDLERAWKNAKEAASWCNETLYCGLLAKHLGLEK